MFATPPLWGRGLTDRAHAADSGPTALVFRDPKSGKERVVEII
jgi:hypothetical protein